MKYENDNVPRSVHLSDFLVVFAGLLHNLVRSFQAMTEELLELSIYHANRKSKISRVWEDFTHDLETLEEDQ